MNSNNLIKYYPNLDNETPEEIQGYTKPGWYFWDETWGLCYGPYSSKSEASQRLSKYAETL